VIAYHAGVPNPQILSRASRGADVDSIVHDLTGRIPPDVRGGVVFCDAEMDVDALRRALANRLDGIPFIGVTSCRGVGTDAGLSQAAGFWLCGDVELVTASAVDADSLFDGLERKGIPTGVNALIGFGTPGAESKIVDLMRERFGEALELTGGGAADNDLTGAWRVFDAEGVFDTGTVALALAWPGRVIPTFNSGYLPSSKKGVATRVDGFTLLEIDGRPAAQVYDEWTAGALGDALERGGPVLDRTTLRPLGVSRMSVGSIPAYLLVHPERVRAEDGAMTLFAQVHEGESVTMMHTTQGSLVRRGAQIVGRALDRADTEAQNIAGAMIINCGGCHLAVEEQASDMLQQTRGVLPGVPFVMPFTFGEFGSVLPGRTDHANLMLSALLFAQPG